jgi:hypothetical protein
MQNQIKFQKQVKCQCLAENKCLDFLRAFKQLVVITILNVLPIDDIILKTRIIRMFKIKFFPIGKSHRFIRYSYSCKMFVISYSEHRGIICSYVV